MAILAVTYPVLEKRGIGGDAYTFGISIRIIDLWVIFRRRIAKE
ncbi:MAG TPA: hypothetical protein VMW53_06675 [archaeon]|nr:hypothetical protein [archaeon]